MKTATMILLVPVLTEATVRFDEHIAWEGDVVHSVQAADYNDDGLLDLIFTAGGKIQLAMAPEFNAKEIYSTPKPLKESSYHSAIMDVDGDGDMDFLAENKGLYWLECPDHPESDPWIMHWVTKAFTGIHCVNIHDVDRDGRKDIVVNNYYHKGQKKNAPNEYPASILWFPVPEDPRDSKAWQPNVLANGDARGGSHYIGFADLDGDGYEEAFHGAKGKPFWWGNYFSYWTRRENVEDPWKKKKLSGRYPGATHIYGGDITGDGAVDLVASCGHGKGIVLFRGPSFHPEKVDVELEAPHAFTLADIDADRDIDLFCCAYTSNKAVWFENDGKGGFTRHLLSSNQQSYDLFICDLESDGDLDVVIAGYQSKNISLFFQQ